MQEKSYDAATKMYKPYPEVNKIGALSPAGESSPFVWKGKLYRLELIDPTRGVSFDASVHASVKEYESGKEIAAFGEGCYYYSFYQENGVAYVLGTLRQSGFSGGDTILYWRSTDLEHWEKGVLLSNPGWVYYNSSLTKAEDTYYILLEASHPKEYVGKQFTFFFAESKDLKNWTFMDYANGYTPARYNGGPFMTYSRGWFYVFSVTELPGPHYTNYVSRTRDFDTWYLSKYNPFLMPSNEDKLISPHMTGLDKNWVKTVCNINNSDVDMCEYNGETVILYNTGNQLGDYYLAEARSSLSLADFLESWFDD